MNDDLKEKAALAALEYVQDDTIIGVGTGSTTAFFIQHLSTIKHRILGAVPSSKETEKKLKDLKINVLDINQGPITLYVDGADEFNEHGQLIKGGGGALTREKILAACSEHFICIADQSKRVRTLGTFPLAIEVIPMARSYVGRELLKMGGNPGLRDHFITDNGNYIIDCYDLDFSQAMKLEETLNNITGVVCHGLFSKRGADVILIGTPNQTETLTFKKIVKG